jgi:transcription antitermination factor NusG
VADDLKQKHFEIFLPLVASRRQWSDRKRVVEFPLFSSYIFAQISGTVEHRVAILQTRGVKGFVGVRGAPIPIPESEIEAVRSLLSAGESLEAHPFVNVGQRVRIRGGSLTGVQGIVVKKNQDLSLVISIEVIERSVSLKLVGYEVEAA